MSNLIADVIENDRKDYHKKVGGQWATLPNSSVLGVVGRGREAFHPQDPELGVKGEGDCL